MNTTSEARTGAAAAWGVLQTYLPLYLDPDGAVRPEVGGLRPLVEFLCEVAAVGTARAVGRGRPRPVPCVSHTAAGPCGAPVRVERAEHPRRLEWRCPRCGASGSIHGAEWTRWDRSTQAKTRTKAVSKTKSKETA